MLRTSCRSSLLSFAQSTVVQWLGLRQWAVSSLPRVLSGVQYCHRHFISPWEYCSSLLPLITQRQGALQARIFVGYRVYRHFAFNAHVCVLLSWHLKSKPSREDQKSTEVSSPPSTAAEMFLPVSTAEVEKRKLVTQDTLESISLSKTPSMSSEEPLSPVARRKFLNKLGLYHCSCKVRLVHSCLILFYFEQLQSLVQQPILQHQILSRGLTTGFPRSPSRSMSLQSAPERGSWDFYQPCYHLSNK